MKTKEELNALKEEVEIVSKKLAELSEEELALVSGGADTVWVNVQCPICKHYGATLIGQNLFMCSHNHDHIFSGS